MALQGTTRLVVFSLTALVVCLPARLAAAQQPASIPSVSLERIRKGLETTPALRVAVDTSQLPVATFRTSVEKRAFVLTLEEQLHKQFDLNLLQRQSADWASQCCGFNLNRLAKGVRTALQGRKERKVHEQVARELAEVIATASK
jgi:hypothetical protein